MQNPDFSAFVQRVKDANPEAVYIFVPGGGQPAAIGKALVDRGLAPPTTRILAQGELTHPEALESMGETARGIITTYHYVLERDDPVNNAFVEAYRAANNGRSPDLFSIGGYDGMHPIYAALEKTGGDTDGAALVEAAKGMAGRAHADRCRSTRKPATWCRPSTSAKCRRSTARCRTSSSTRSRT